MPCSPWCAVVRSKQNNPDESVSWNKEENLLIFWLQFVHWVTSYRDNIIYVIENHHENLVVLWQTKMLRWRKLVVFSRCLCLMITVHYYRSKIGFTQAVFLIIEIDIINLSYMPLELVVKVCERISLWEYQCVISWKDDN